MDSGAIARVLVVVDDNSMFIEKVSRCLRGCNWTVQSFTNPLDYLAQQTARLTPDVLIVDARMPQMDGLEFVERLADNAGEKVMRVFMCSEICPPESTKQRLDQLGIGFVTKSAFRDKEHVLKLLGG